MGRKRGRAVNMTITVPTSLRRRMSALDETENWSKVAGAAFEARLAAVARGAREEDMKRVIERLRATKQKGDDGRYEEGRAAGGKWAAMTASAAELERLAAAWEKIDAGPGGRDELFDSSGGGSAAERVAYLTMAEGEQSRKAAADFWADAGVDVRAANEASFLTGFVQAASELWAEVKDLL